ncbi:MAG: type II secretion system protein [Planctomycetota bacterium]|nr:type II secretion system protein [Planctomycetota bacterium]
MASTPAQHGSPRQSTGRGFTVVELIIVVGIIGLLLGLAFPAIRTFRMEAKNVECLSNLRQIGTILQSYMNQNRDIPPMTDFIPTATDNGPRGGLPWALRGYISTDNKCWCCPADTDETGSLSTGTSYCYVPGLLRYSPSVQIQVQQALIPYYLNPNADEDAIERRRTEMESRLVTAFYRRDGQRMAFLTDSVDRHPGSRIPRNALFFDGSVGVSTDLEQILENADDQPGVPPDFGDN